MNSNHRCTLTGQNVLEALAAPSSAWVEDTEYCGSSPIARSVCIGGRRWRPGRHYGHCELPLRGKREACAVLAKKNITEILVVGDSFARHLHISLNLLLSEQLNLTAKEGCRPSDGFVDGPCALPPMAFTWCEGAVQGRFHDRRRYCRDCGKKNAANGDVPIADVPRNRLVLHGVGVHPVTRNFSLDINNATMKKLSGGVTHSLWAFRSKLNFPVQRDYWWKRPCERQQSPRARASLGRAIWLPPHFRVAIGRYDDSNTRARNFSASTARYFMEECGGIPTLSIDEPTRAAARLLCRAGCEQDVSNYVSQKHCKLVFRDTCADASWVTHDGYHWNSAVNLLKVQLLLAYLAGEGT